MIANQRPPIDELDAAFRGPGANTQRACAVHALWYELADHAASVAARMHQLPGEESYAAQLETLARLAVLQGARHVAVRVREAEEAMEATTQVTRREGAG